MSGVSVVDRRDLERLLKAVVHSMRREDVKVDVKFYLQFSLTDDYSAQTLVDPWQPFTRAQARDLVKAAIERLDEEEKKHDGARKALQVINGGNDANPEAAEASPSADESPDLPAESAGPAPVAGGVIGDPIDAVAYDENPGVIL